MVNEISISINDIIKENRFNPKFFKFKNDSTKLQKSSSLKFINLGDQNYFPLLSDGIHSAVELKTEGAVRYLYVHNLKEAFIDVVDSLYIADVDFKKNITKQLKDRAVLLSVVGTLGNTAIYKKYVNATCTLPRNIAYMYCNEQRILPEYLTCFFMSEFSKFQCIYSGGGNVQGLLSLTKLKKFVVPVPELSVQELFRKKLDHAMDLQASFLQAIEKCKAIFYDKIGELTSKQRRIHFSLSVFDIMDNNSFIPKAYEPQGSGILESIGKKFKLVELGDHVDINKGEEIGSDNYLDYLNKTTDSRPFLRTSDIFNYELDSYPDYYCKHDIYSGLKQIIQKNDIVFSKDGSIGNISMVTSEDNQILSSGFAIIRIKESSNLSPYYIFFILLLDEIGKYQAVKNTVIASTIPHLKISNIAKFKVPILDEYSMKTIGDLIQEAFSKVETKKKLIKQIKKNINELIGYNC
ncbi:MAG: restriction endonuclease subunit S [Flavipsychrobacter sp.]